MTNEIKLLLGEEKYEVDISSTQPISINYSIRDIKDYSKRKASFTKPFSILRTKKIDKIFKSLYNVNSIDFDLSKTIPAIIKKNTGILKGNMTITDITSNSYEVVVSTNNVNIFNELGDDLIVGNDTNLKDVQIPGLFNITRQGIRDSWANYTGSNDFIFPVVDHGNDISSLSKIENNYPILPSISAKYLFDNIIKSKGYTYSLSPIIDKYLSKMYIPYNNNYDLLGEDTKVAEYYMLPLVGPSDPDIRLSYRSINDITGGYYYIDDKFNNITTAGRYANEDPEFRFNTRYFGNYAINIKFKLKYTGTLPPDALGKKGLELSLTCHGGNNEVNKVWKETKQLAQFRDNAYREIDETFYFNDVNPNTTFTFCINGESYGVDSLTEAQKADLWRVEKGTNSINVSILKYLYSGKDLPKSLMLPLKYKKSDFINDIFKIFNAYVTIDELDEKKLIINSYNEFDSSCNYKDITKLIDSKSIKIEPLSKYIGSGYNFTFGDDNSIYNNDFNDRFNNQPYYKSVNFNNDYSSEVTDIELSSTSTIIRRLNTTTENIFIPVIATSGKFTSEQNHRILFVNNNIGMSKYNCYFGTDTNDYISSFLSLSTTYNQNDLSNLDNMVLSFDNNVSYFNDYKTGCNSTIYNKFYINDLENKNTKECRFMTVNANINEYYLNDIKFNDYLLIKSTTYGNSYWRLNAIKNYNPITHNCSLELIKSSRDSKIYNPTVVLNPISLLIPEESSTTGTGGSSTGGTGTGSSYSKIEIDNFLSLKLDKDVAINKYALINGNILNDFSAKSFIENGVSLSSKYLQAASLIGYAKETWVTQKITDLINSAPSTLDTLNELAAALGNDPNFATTVTNLIATKAPIESPNFTGVPRINNNIIYHAGNANLTTVDWNCNLLTSNGAVIKGTIAGTTGIICNSVLTDANIPITGSLPIGMRFDRGSSGFLNTPTAVNNANGLLTLTSHPTGGTGTYGKQLFFTDNEELYIRRFSNGTALPWKNIWHSGNSNLSTVDWNAKDLKLGTKDTNGIYMDNGANVHNIVSRNDGYLLFGRYGIRNDFYIDNGGSTHIEGVTISNVRHTTSFAGNWQHSGYWGIGEDEASGNYWVKVQGWNNGWNNNAVNLNVTGEVKVGGTRVASSNQNGSGFTATGWQIGDYSNLNNLDVRSRLQVYEFVQNKINISNGNLIVTDSAKVDSVWFWVDAGSSGTGQHVRYSFTEQHPFKVGDIIRCQSKGKSYIVTVGYIDTNGLFFDAYNAYNNAGVSASAAGDLLIRWNSNDVNRSGLLYLNSSDTNAPNFQIIKDGQIKGCFGNCAGLNWQGSTLPANSYGTWIDNGWFNGAVNANSGNIGGWKITGDSIDSTNNDVRIHSGVKAILITKPTGGHVTLGQTYINGVWTGKFGIGATNANSQELFRLDEEVNRIAGWNFDNYQLHTGTNSAGLTPKIRLSNSNVGSNFIYTGERHLEGLSLTWHRSNNAGHLVFGQLAANGNTLKDGFKGIQMMDWLGNEYFALGANVNVENNGSHYCKIAGWNFDSYHLYSGYMSLNANGSIEHTGGKWALNNNGSGKLAGGNITWDDAGNATFNGIINASGGNFTGTVNATRGRIGVFDIRNEGLYTTGITSGSFITLSPETVGIKIEGIGGLTGFNKTFSAGGSSDSDANEPVVSIGNLREDGNKKIALNVASFNGTGYNTSIRAIGNISCYGAVLDCGVQFINKLVPLPATTKLSIKKATTFVVTNNTDTDNCYIEMPTIADIRNATNTSYGEPFAIKIKVIAKYDTPRLFYVGYDNSEYQVRDYNGGLSSYKLSGGDSIEILIINDGTNTWGQITGLLR